MVSSLSLDNGSQSRSVRLEEKVRVIAIGTAIIARQQRPWFVVVYGGDE